MGWNRVIEIVNDKFLKRPVILNSHNNPIQYGLNSFQTSFLHCNSPLIIPPIPISGWNSDLIEVICDFIFEHLYEALEGAKLYWPPSQKTNMKSLSFLRPTHVSSNVVKVWQMTEVLVEYMGGAKNEEIYRPRTQENAPGFETNFIYFRSRLIPLRNTPDIKANLPLATWYPDFIQKEIEDENRRQYVKSNQNKDGSTIEPNFQAFDAPDYKRFSDILLNLGPENFTFSRLCPPFVYESMCLKWFLVRPDMESVNKAAGHFNFLYEHLRQHSHWSNYPQDKLSELQSLLAERKMEKTLSRQGNVQWLI